MDGALAEILGDFGRRVIGAERLLVDVLLEDIAENVGIDFVIVLAGDVVQIPGVAAEEGEYVFESFIGDGDVRVFDLYLVGQEKAAVEVLDLSQQRPGSSAALVFGLGESLEK